MKRQLFATIFFLALNKSLFSQTLLYRYSYRHEIYLTGRVDKDYRYILPSIGYEFSFNKNKTYVSLANEFLSALSLYKYNISDGLMSTVKINYQSKNILSLGAGVKHNFNVKHTNFVAIGTYKQDLFKYNLTFSANILFEIEKPTTSRGGANPVCLQNCPTHFYLWSFGFVIGKYF